MFLAFALLLAADTPAAAPATAAPEKKVCRWAEPEIGSNMPGKKTCKTKSEWAATDKANEQNAERYKRERSQGGRVQGNSGF